MIVNSTEVQNNFGKYLMLAAQQEIIITRNGMEIAKLCPLGEGKSRNDAVSAIVAEEASRYGYGMRKATYEEFLELTKDSPDRFEYIDGEIYQLASPKTPHQLALAELHVQFYTWFEGKKCRAMLAPYDITLWRSPEHINVVQPDLMVICDLDEKLGDDGYYKGVPTLLVEVISESSRRKDVIKKLDLYLSCGVEEYWIVDPQNKEITVYSFKDREFDTHKTYELQAAAESQVFPGLAVEVAQVFR